ncbi:MAG: HAD-IIIA family hydrolase [Deltaproteobacteria bacterium]|nr:MAG: HAD-IIIA family hydrolase [Deltaproteobacteria bacterium]
MTENWATRIKLLILDVDGVMTDGRIIMNHNGEEIKCFHVRDGHGLRLLLSAGIDVIIISGRKSKTVEYRAKELGIQEIYQGVKEKESLCRKLIQRKKLEREQVCCMGDDLPDLPMFNQAGISIAVADAVTEVRTAASFVTKNRGGNGAVREVCELILKAQEKWPDAISAFLREGE